MTTTTFITERLDELEANLPAVPARVVRLQRAIAGAACDQTAAVATAVATSTRTVLDAARISGRTVTGQARAAADDVVSSARGGARQVTGQARAQGRRIASTASRETTQLLDSAIDTVEDVDDATVGGPGAGTPYEQWTKAQLLERARQLDVEGAYKLNKRQLVKALRSA
jgi:cell division septum initiation protein DivIVA